MDKQEQHTSTESSSSTGVEETPTDSNSSGRSVTEEEEVPAVARPSFPHSQRRGGRKKQFPQQLFAMLSESAWLGHSYVVSWHVDGRSFFVNDQAEMVRSVLPRYFGQTKWTSFQRQLNLYGFEKISSGPCRGGYYNENLQRDRPDLVAQIERRTSSANTRGVPSQSVGQSGAKQSRRGQHGSGQSTVAVAHSSGVARASIPTAATGFVEVQSSGGASEPSSGDAAFASATAQQLLQQMLMNPQAMVPGFLMTLPVLGVSNLALPPTLPTYTSSNILDPRPSSIIAPQPEPQPSVAPRLAASQETQETDIDNDSSISYNSSTLSVNELLALPQNDTEWGAMFRHNSNANSEEGEGDSNRD